MRIGLAAAFLVVLFQAPALAQTTAPMAAVGILRAGNAGGCSASLIGSDVVLTAAHCVPRSGKPADNLRFMTGAYPGAPRIEVPVASVAYHPLYTLNLEPETTRIRFDLALVRLAHPIDHPAIVPLPLGAAPDVGEQLWLASYRGGVGDRARERRCPVFPGPRELTALGCEVMGGESGSPLMRNGPDGLEIVAVLSSRSRVREQPIGFASPVLPRIDQVFEVLPDAPDPDAPDPDAPASAAAGPTATNAGTGHRADPATP